MLACSRALCFYKSQNTQPKKKKKNTIEYKVKQKWDSSFGVVGRDMECHLSRITDNSQGL